MKKIKHNKIKNTGLLFEVLIRNFSVNILNEKNSNKSSHLLKKYFAANTELGKELSLYNMLSESKIKDTDKANYIIDTAIQMRKGLNEDLLRKQKYNLIKEISEAYDLKSFFDIKINNYKLLASCYKLFEFKLGNSQPTELIQSRFSILECITGKDTIQETIPDSDIKMFLSQEPEVKILAYNEMVNQFNENYVSKLTKEQKDLLNLYIKSNPNENTFREQINTKIDLILNEITNYNKLVKDFVLKTKLNEVSKSINRIKNTKILNEKHIITVMRFYDLIDSLKKI